MGILFKNSYDFNQENKEKLEAFYKEIGRNPESASRDLNKLWIEASREVVHSKKILAYAAVVASGLSMFISLIVIEASKPLSNLQGTVAVMVFCPSLLALAFSSLHEMKYDEATVARRRMNEQFMKSTDGSLIPNPTAPRSIWTAMKAKRKLRAIYNSPAPSK